MKKYIYATALVLIMVSFLMALAGCNKADDPVITEPTASIRNFKLTHVDSGIIQYQADEFNASGFLDLYPDGTAKLQYADQSISLLYDESNLWSADAPDELHPYRISGMVLVLEYHTDILTFVEK